MSELDCSNATLTRRSFLKTTAAVAGAAAVAGGVSFQTVDAVAEEAAPAVPVDGQYINTCRGNCGGQCPLVATVREGKITQVTPVIAPDDCREGQLGCVRGQTTPQRVYSTRRVLYPMLQTGERGSDNWEQITWDEAIDLIAQKFQAAFDEYGAKSVAFWGSFGSLGYLSKSSPGFSIGNIRIKGTKGVALERFLQKTGATVFAPSSDMAGIYMQNAQLAIPMSGICDMTSAKTILFWGANPAVSMRPTWQQACKARDNGAKLICIDPVYTRTAAICDEWLPIQGGTDAALMLAIGNWIIDNDLVDYEYMKHKSVAPLLIKEDGTYLKLSDLGELPEGTADTEVVWDEDAAAFVSSFASTNPALLGSYEVNGILVRTVFDLTKELIAPFTIEFAVKECGLTEEQILNVADLYVNNGPSTIVCYWGIEHFSNSYHVYPAMMLLSSLAGQINKKGAGVMHIPGGTAYSWCTGFKTNSADVMLPDAKDGVQITGEYLPQIMKTGQWAGEDFPIRSVYVMNANPLSSGLGRTEVCEAFRAVDFTVVADSFMTDTALNASLVLPISLSWECNDHTGATPMQQAVAPAGECKTDLEVFKLIADRLGYTDLYTKTADEYLRDYLDTEENVAAGNGYDLFANGRGFIENWQRVGDIVGAERNPTGRTQFYAANMTPRDPYGQEVKLTDRAPFYEKATEAYPDNPLREKYPLFGMSLHDNYHGHSLFNGIPWLDELRGEPFVKIHEEAAAARGIENGDIVRVFNDRGHVVLKAVVTSGIRPDTILLPHGWESPDFISGHPQSLTGLFLDPITSNNNYNDMLVEVEKYEGSAE